MKILKYCVIVVILLVTTSISGYGQNFDARLLHAINSNHDLSSDGFFKFMSNTNSIVVLATPASIGIAGLINKDKPMMYNACMIGLAGAINVGITMTMKYTFNRNRPFNEYPGYITKKSDAGSASFPSGHTSSAFANATALSLIYPKWYVIAPAYLWAGTVAYSRMHLGVHYPTDVLIGILVGVGSAYLSYKGNQWLTRKYNYLGN